MTDFLLPKAALDAVNQRMVDAAEKGKKDPWGWIDKPYTRKELLDKISRHLNKRRNGTFEDEDGSHVAAICCNALMLLQYEIGGIGLPLTVENIAEGLHVGRKDADENNRIETAPVQGGPEDASGESGIRTEKLPGSHPSDGPEGDKAKGG